MNNSTMTAICSYIVTECGDDIQLDEDGYFQIYDASDKTQAAAVYAYINTLADRATSLIMDDLTRLDLDEAMPQYLRELWADQNVDKQISESRELADYDGANY